jgi:hypothetical protein
MKKIIGLTFSILLLVACGSKKGAWTAEEKQKAKNFFNKILADAGGFGKDKQTLINCFVETMEKRYDNFDASTDAGRTLVLVDCMKPLVKKYDEESQRNLKN